jgi:sugar phosphate isomerase/epimerase
MRLSSDPAAELLYCLNVFPDASPSGFRREILPGLEQIKKRVSPDQPMGLGLRFSADQLMELEDPGLREQWLDELNQASMYGVTFNAFPYGAFHGERVKENVYAPDWRCEDRLAYTLRSARLLADSMPQKVTGSISTVPGSYGAWIQDDAAEESMLQNLVRCVWGLHQLEQETGKRIHLGLEPEPDGFLETTSQCVDYWKEHVLQAGVETLSRLSGRDKAQSEACIRRHLGVCFDACHLAIQFEDLAESVDTLHREGILLSKAHISAALDVRPVEKALARLREFDEPVYLHQVRALGPDKIRRGWPDLRQALNSLPGEGVSRLRVHFHVPLYWEGDPDFQSTAEEITPDFIRSLMRAGCEHFEVETYTFDVLPEELRAEDLPGMMQKELAWFKTRWEKSLVP